LRHMYVHAVLSCGSNQIFRYKSDFRPWKLYLHHF